MDDIIQQWYSAFLKTVQQHENSIVLKESALKERLSHWTTALTSVVVATCETIGWRASAKGHLLEMLPVHRSEYLALDVMAFADSNKRWRFPVAVMELENSKNNNLIAYSLWKVLCVRADLRIVFCYRKTSEESSTLIGFLRNEVIQAMALSGRITLHGETLIVVGSRDDSATFPYKFFKWWQLDKNTGTFHLI